MEGRHNFKENGKIGLAEVVGGLVGGEGGGEVVRLPGGECWTVSFDDAGSNLAWSSGFRKIVVLPWKSVDKITDNKKVIIDAGYPVTAITFGSFISSAKNNGFKRDYWLRFDAFTNLFILASGHANGRIRIWDTYYGKLILELTDHTKPVTDLSFAPDSSLRLASSSRDGTVKVWDMSDDGNLIKTLKDQKSPINSITWHPSARLLCSAGDKQKVLIWDMKDYVLRTRLFGGHYNTVTSCCFSPDGAILATSSADTRVIIWNHETGEKIRIFHHVFPPPRVIYMSGEGIPSVRKVTFNNLGSIISTICDDGKVRFFDLLSPSPFPISEGNSPTNDSMLTCTFSPGGGVLCVGFESGSVLFFDAPKLVAPLLHLSRSAIRKSITPPSSPSGVSPSTGLPLPSSLLKYLAYRLP